MGTSSWLYRIVLLLHIGAVIVAFGGIIANAMLNARSFRGPAGEASVLLPATGPIAKLAEYALYAVLPLGIVLVAISDDAIGFDEGWISASFLVWFAMVGVIHGLIRPAVRTMTGRAAAVTGSTTLEADPEATAASRRLMMGEGALELLLVIALFLMIWKPGA